ncbi:MAG: hypothetical protein IJH75_01190 [Mogibacterium sp.]|nr:hypothetical protein [Mogibacterium sp.]
MKRKIGLMIGVVFAVMVLLAGCGETGDAGSEDLEIEGFYGHTMSAEEYFWYDSSFSVPEALKQSKMVEVAGIVTNHSDQMIYMASMVPVAYDADGIEEPDHVGWKVDKVMKVKGEQTTYGLEIESSDDGYGTAIKVTNNSEEDRTGISIDMIVMGEDGRIVPGGLLGMDYNDEDAWEYKTLAPHESYEEYIDYWGYDISYDAGGRVECFVRYDPDAAA